MDDASSLLESWTGPFGMPPIDRIRPSHFANTMETLQRSGRAACAAGGGRHARPDGAVCGVPGAGAEHGGVVA